MVPKRSRRLTELDDMIIPLYAGEMTVRDFQDHLAATLGVDMSPDSITMPTGVVVIDGGRYSPGFQAFPGVIAPHSVYDAGEID